MTILKKIQQQFSSLAYFFKAVPALVWQLLFFCIPIACILLLSFLKKSFLTFSLDIFTLEHYLNLPYNASIKIIMRSLLVASITALLCLLIGYPVSYFIALKKRNWKNIFLFFLILPFVTNLLVLTYAWSFILDNDGLINSLLMHFHIINQPLTLLNNFFAIMVVMFYCYLPFMIMPLYASLEKFDLTLIEASRDLGANQWQTFFKIILPLTVPAIQTGILLVFVPAFGEFVIPMLVGGDKYMFVGTLIAHLFLIGQDRTMGAAFTFLTSIVLCTIVLFFIIALHRRRKPQEIKA